METDLVGALLYGKLDGLSEAEIFLFARTGLLHLFSASGFHMGAALMMAELAARILSPALKPSWRKFVGFLFSISLMTFFGCVTEWSSPLVRAYAFTTLLIGARVWEVKPGKAWIFVLSLLVAAVLGKGSMLSFLLSAAGMAGVLLVGGSNPLTLAIGPWLFTMPLVIWHFSLFSLASPFWNLTIGLLVSWLVLPPAILGLLLESVGIGWRGPHLIAESLMKIFTSLLARGDEWVGLALWVNPLQFFCVSGALAGAYLLYSRHRTGALSLGLGALALGAFWPSLKLGVLNVGQGDSVYIHLSSSASLLVDAGPPPWKKFTAKGAAALERQALRLDHLLLTHADRDHIGGAPSILSRHRVGGAIWLREEIIADPRIQPVLEMAERAGAKIKFLRVDLPSRAFVAGYRQH